jgi:HPt (histidine-containing phosphotransfer) domain-containing protein
MASAGHAIKGAALMLSLTRLSAAAKDAEMTGKALNGDKLDEPPSDEKKDEMLATLGKYAVEVRSLNAI